MKNTTFKALVLLTSLSSHLALAAYSDHERSLSGTGETLRKGGAELGVATLAYGLSDNLTLSTTTWPLAFGSAMAQMKYKFTLNDSIRLTPYISGGYDWHSHQSQYGAGATLGFDLGSPRNSIAFSGGLLHAPTLDAKHPNTPSSAHNQARVQVEFDHYTEGGNLFFVGALNNSMYTGYTWAWDHFHLGFVSSSAVNFIPLPYLYWRF